MPVSRNDNGLFEETNEQCIFSKVLYNQLRFTFPVWNIQWKTFQSKNSSLKQIYNNNKTKVKILWPRACDKLHM